MKKQHLKYFLFYLFILLNSVVLGQRSSVRLTQNWEFVKGDLGGIYEAIRPEKLSKLPVWVKVDMPHCFNAFDAVDPDVAYYQGPGWYRTALEKSTFKEGQRYLLHFEGAGQKTKVFINDQLVGEHVGGYDEFTVDITESVLHFFQVTNAETVPVVVRCDNSRDLEMIPSDLSDFNVYGGLYRYVNLVQVSQISIAQIHADTKVDLKKKKAQLKVTPTFYQPAKEGVKATMTYRLTDPSGNEVKVEKVMAESLDPKALSLNVEINHPRLWTTDEPELYTLTATLETASGTDSYAQKIGFRNFEFIPHGPFLLNGKRLFLRGTHRHEDHAGTGAAMPENLIIQEMQMIKEMGVNFIRLAHYQQSRIVLDACDSLGILVWEEIPWCRGGLGHESYKAQARRMLTNMINQHYNHPSVIIWGLGNENDWPGDFPEFEKDSIRAFMSDLNDLAHRLDPVRKTAIRRCDFCSDIVDVYSPSVWAGWYRGKYTDYTQVSEDWNQKVTNFLHVEWGASNHANRHSENPDKGIEAISGGKGADERAGDFLLHGGEARVSKDGDWSETYACNLIDWHLKEQEKMDWHTGTAFWIFKDFSTPLRPENPVPYVNQKGVVQRDFTKKEAFYVFQSYWTEKPMAHIYGHTWPVRWGDENEEKMVKVYSNCNEAELFLNGKSMGVKQRDSQNFPAAGLCWNIKFKQGENQLKVIAHKGKVEVVDSISQFYQTQKWDAPAVLKFEEIHREGNIVEVEAKAYDENTVFCPDAKNQIRFSIAGDGELIDDLGTSNGSRVIQLYNGRASIRFKLTGAEAVVAAQSDSLKTAFITVKQ